MKKMNSALLALVIGLITINASAQTFEWARNFGGPSADIGTSIAVDASGNVYTTGYFLGTVDFDPGPYATILSSNGNYDVFVQKVDAAGNLLWAKSFGGTNADFSNSIAVDGAGNVFVTGSFEGTTDFDPGAGTNTLSPNGASDVFVQKMDASGNFLWAKSFGGLTSDFGYSIAADASGDVYVTGSFEGVIDFDPGVGTYTLSSNGNADAFVQKMDASGNFLWANAFGGATYDEGKSMAIDASGDVYITGFFEASVDFDPGAGTSVHNSAGANDIFVQKLDALGNFLWAKTFGGLSSDYGSSIAVDVSGNIYTTGSFTNSVDFDPGAGTSVFNSVQGYDIFVQKMDASGNFLWAKPFGGTDHDLGNSIAVDASGNVYTTGSFRVTVDFDPGAGTFELSAVLYPDIFIQKMDGAGNFIWAMDFGANFTQDSGESITVDASGNIYSTGKFAGVADFDPSAADATLNSTGDTDVFIHKMSQCIASTGTDIQMACDSYTWIDGNTYTSSNNIATYTLTNAAGCDSVVTLNLTINNSATGTDVQTHCDSYTWIDGNTYTSSNNAATYTLTNAQGCDSVVTLNLTINNSATGTDVQTHCDSYTWIDGNTYTSSNNTATHVIAGGASNGCDSIVTLNLTINSVSNLATSVLGTTIIAANGNATYQWLDCDDNFNVIPSEIFQGFSPSVNGYYAVELTENGCVDTSDCVAITTVGIEENSFGDKFKVFPNPTNGDFSIDMGNIYEKSEILITDLTGKLIDSKTTEHSQILKLSLKEPAGIYIVSIEAGEKMAMVRLVKQ